MNKYYKMPKKEINDYVFYKIICISDDINLCYVGSTANFIKRRIAHKSNCYNENSKHYNSKIFKTIRENGGWDNFKMIQIGTREQLTKRESEAIEEEYRQELRANMNSRRCFRTDEQRQEYHRDKANEYYENNIDKCKDNAKKYYENNIDKAKKYYQNNKDKFKEYRENNIDKIKEYRKYYYQKNKNKNKS